MSLFHRISNLFSRGKLERAIQDEPGSHLDMRPPATGKRGPLTAQRSRADRNYEHEDRYFTAWLQRLG